MTSPMPGFEAIAPLAQPNYFRLRITESDADQDALRKAVKEAVSARLIAYAGMEYRANRQDGQAEIRIKLTDTNGTDYYGDAGDSVVLTYHGDTLAAITLYNGPDGVRTTNRKYSELFPADEPQLEPDALEPDAVTSEPDPVLAEPAPKLP